MTTVTGTPGTPGTRRAPGAGHEARAGAPPGRAAGPSRSPQGLRRWRVPLAIIALVVLGGTVIALLAPPARPNTYLDPASNLPAGANALTDILGERGVAVRDVYSVPGALAGIRSAGPAGTTLVVTSPGLLTAGQRRRLWDSGADLFLVAPDQASLATLSPDITVTGENNATVPVSPRCRLPAARLAGPADLGGFTYLPQAFGYNCYPVGTGGFPALLRYARAGRTVTIVGSGDPFTNELLADEGNAALAINLLGTSRSIVWLTPEQAAAAHGPAAGRGSSRPAIIPPAAWLVVVQLCIAALLAAAWRARRFGPLISERLPVVVRASETVEGHGRLYRARRARDRTATALREASLGRLVPALGLARGAPQAAVAAAVAAKSGRSEPEVAALLFGPPPQGDAELVGLAHNLDELEREVRSS